MSQYATCAVCWGSGYSITGSNLPPSDDPFAAPCPSCAATRDLAAALTAANQRAAGLEAGVERLKGLLEQVTPFVEGWAQRNRPIYDRDKDGDAMGYFSIGDVRRARRLGDELKAALQDAER